LLRILALKPVKEGETLELRETINEMEKSLNTEILKEVWSKVQPKLQPP
jgi:hypothetical protein